MISHPRVWRESQNNQVDLLLSLAQRATDNQWDNWKFVDSRGQFLLGWLLTAVAVGVALGLGRSPATPLVDGLLLSAALCTVITLLLLIGAYWPRTYFRPPDPTVLTSDYFAAEVVDTKLVVLDTIARTYTLNERQLGVKLLLTKAALVLAPMAGLLGLLALVAMRFGTTA